MHDHQGDGPAMNQLIFNIGLSVETISLYLLCCGLVDAGRNITYRSLVEIWNDTPESLTEGLQFLERKKILRRIDSDQPDSAGYELTGIEHWKI